MVVLDERWELRKQLALVRVLDMAFELQKPFGARQLEQLVQHAEELEIVLLGIARSLHRLAESLGGSGQHRSRVADDEGAHRGADDDQRLERLHQHEDMAAHQDVTAENASQNDDDANDKEHFGPGKRDALRPRQSADFE